MKLKNFRYRIYDKRTKQMHFSRDCELTLGHKGLYATLALNGVEYSNDVTMELCTGMFDYAGVELYEGDIVKFGDDNTLGVIVFDTDGFQIKYKTGWLWGYMRLSRATHLECHSDIHNEKGLLELTGIPSIDKHKTNEELRQTLLDSYNKANKQLTKLETYAQLGELITETQSVFQAYDNALVRTAMEILEHLNKVINPIRDNKFISSSSGNSTIKELYTTSVLFLTIAMNDDFLSLENYILSDCKNFRDMTLQELQQQALSLIDFYAE